MPVGEQLPFFLDPTHPPQWSQQSREEWRAQVGDNLRLLLECHRDGHEPWILPAEMRIDAAGAGRTGVPNELD